MMDVGTNRRDVSPTSVWNSAPSVAIRRELTGVSTLITGVMGWNQKEASVCIKRGETLTGTKRNNINTSLAAEGETTTTATAVWPSDRCSRTDNTTRLGNKELKESVYLRMMSDACV